MKDLNKAQQNLIKAYRRNLITRNEYTTLMKGAK
jgi:hypothetical protein